MSITLSQIQRAYEAAKRAFNGEISESEAANNLSTHFGINNSTANTFVRVLAKMLRGQLFTRGLSIPATRFYLRKVSAEYGKQGLRDALNALALRTSYYEARRQVTMHGLRGVHAEFNNLL